MYKFLKILLYNTIWYNFEIQIVYVSILINVNKLRGTSSSADFNIFLIEY